MLMHAFKKRTSATSEAVRQALIDH